MITPRPEAGVVTRLKMNLRSPSLIPHRPCRIRYQIPVSFHLTARTKSELELSVSESGNEELCSELSPSPQGLPNDDKVGVQSVYGVSDNSPLPARYQTTGECSPYDGSTYTSSNHQTDGQPDCSGSDCLQQSFPDGKPGRGLPSIDDMANQ